jgi:5-methylcytosine-specific restriction endonuclease McrA
MDAATRRFVKERARNRCEYCLLPQNLSPLASLQVEHIIPRKHQGHDELDNLALACIDCNLHKGPYIAGFDPFTGDLTRLFHPRLDNWSEHFKKEGAYIVGNTAIGPTTVNVLQFNSEEQIQLRASIE